MPWEDLNQSLLQMGPQSNYIELVGITFFSQLGTLNNRTSCELGPHPEPRKPDPNYLFPHTKITGQTVTTTPPR